MINAKQNLFIHCFPSFKIFISDEISHYFPSELGQKLIKLHADPKAFWFGQFSAFIMRKTQKIDETLKRAENKFDLPQIYVGSVINQVF